MTTKLKPPVTRYAKLFLNDTQEALDLSLRPLSRANIGDFVGFQTEIRAKKQGGRPRVSSEGYMLTKGEKSKTPIDFQSYHNFDDKNGLDFQHFARLCLAVEHDFLLKDVLHSPFEEINPHSDHETSYSIILTQQAIILCHDDQAAAADWAVDEGYACQENISKLIQMVLPEGASAHEDMELAPHIENALSLMNLVCDTYDEDDEQVEFIFPDLTG